MLRRDTAGRTLGLKCGSRTAAAPDCAKEPLALWTLFIGFAAMCVSRGAVICALPISQ